MEWDWTTFVPTLLATFLGVFLSFTAYRLWDWYTAKRQRASTKNVLLIEIADNLARLTSFKSAANKVLNGEGTIRTLYRLFPVHTNAYNAAFQSGEIHRLGDSTLEKALIEYAVRCEGFNTGMQLAVESLTEKCGSLNNVQLDIAQGSVRFRLPHVEDLINRSNDLIKMMTEDRGESNTLSEQSTI